MAKILHNIEVEITKAMPSAKSSAESSGNSAKPTSHPNSKTQTTSSKPQSKYVDQVTNSKTDEDLLKEKIELLVPGFSDYRILKKSVDARRKTRPHFVYSVEVAESGETLKPFELIIPKTTQKISDKPIIIGAGPGGLFAALRLVERGIPCRLFERGSRAEERIKGINRFWRYGEFDARNNVCFGEGGAGLYSDGKLITRIKSPHIPYVLNRLVQFGAPDEIQYLANPHVGSDRIRRLIPKIREYLISHGCEMHFDTQVTEILTASTNTSATGSVTNTGTYPDTSTRSSSSKKNVIGVRTEHGEVFHSSHVIVATGHSADDMLHHLQEIDVFLEGKSFAMGLRIEHPQKSLNQIQYREFSENSSLGAANYKLAYTDPDTSIGTYSFCMCPGGYVLNATTSQNLTICNGMSNYNRNSPFGNAAIVVSIDHDKMFGAKNIFGGLKYRTELETRAHLAATGSPVDSASYKISYASDQQQPLQSQRLPGQSLMDFLEGKKPKGDLLKNSSLSGAVPAALHQILPKEIYQSLVQGLMEFNKSMRGFIHEEAQLFGVESRTSCPVRVTRDKDSLESVSHQGLYPCGEGAGYAGGITSAACDGVRIAEKIAAQLLSQFESLEF